MQKLLFLHQYWLKNTAINSLPNQHHLTARNIIYIKQDYFLKLSLLIVTKMVNWNGFFAQLLEAFYT